MQLRGSAKMILLPHKFQYQKKKKMVKNYNIKLPKIFILNFFLSGFKNACKMLNKNDTSGV